jgi:hypothetical protein
MSAALTDATETAARAYRLASNAQTTITGQRVTLGTLAANVSTLTSDIDNLRTSIKLHWTSQLSLNPPLIP